MQAQQVTKMLSEGVAGGGARRAGQGIRTVMEVMNVGGGDCVAEMKGEPREKIGGVASEL